MVKRNSCVLANTDRSAHFASSFKGSIPHAQMVAPRREIRAQDELAFETARLDTAVCVGDLVEGNLLGDARPYGVSGQQAEEPLQVLVEPRGMSRSHRVD